jgi:hypothetical protein
MNAVALLAVMSPELRRSGTRNTAAAEYRLARTFVGSLRRSRLVRENGIGIGRVCEKRELVDGIV